ncbi:MAG: tetratricopeptide repeat protein [Bacteroidota bacterium]|nr:tetratricopeptide repeat protein [Bacteroidota bacterium]
MSKKALILFFIIIYFPTLIRASVEVDSIRKFIADTSDPLKKFEGYYRLVLLSNSPHQLAEAEIYLAECRKLEEVIKTPKTTARLSMLVAIVTSNKEENDLAMPMYAKTALQLKALGMKQELSDLYSFWGVKEMDLGDPAKALSLFTKSTALAKELNNRTLECENLIFAGKAYLLMGNSAKAVENLLSGLKMAGELQDNEFISEASLMLGAVYSDGNNQEYAMKYLNESARISEAMKDTSMLINTYTYLANNHYYNKRYKEALDMYEKVKIYCLTHGSRNLYAGTLGNMGNVYADMGDYERGMPLQFEAAAIFEEVGDVQGIIICYTAIAVDYLNLKQYDKSLLYFNKVLPLAQDANSTLDLIEIHGSLARLYEETKDYQKAYENFKLYSVFNDSVYNQDNARKLTELQMNYQFESKQKEADLQQELTNERFKRVIVMAVAGIVLLLVIVFIVYRSNRLKKKANKQLAAFNTEILLQKQEIEVKRTLIEEAYNDIKSSINYAKRIQEAILPVRDEIKKAFADSFILFKPRDVVSGDFFWYAHRGNKKIIACVDCTGHGVPGAFMSLIGNTLLNEIVNEKGIEQPSFILNLLHERVRQSLKQDHASNEARDGMDMMICVFEEGVDTMQYAGANRPLFHIRDGVLTEIKPDKISIGGEKMEEDRSFTNQVLQLKKNDCFYMSSDGYADQFGGEKGKKFMVKRFHQLLVVIHQLPMEKQGEQLKTTIEGWQGNLEQVDDMLVIGIRV